MNQREIKFKLWSKRDGWCGGFCVHQTGLISTCINAEIVEPQHMAVADAHWQDLSEQNDLILLQYTGLKDKNGKEIYESDIVYLSGYGNYEVKFPFIQLYEAGQENDIGEVKGNVYESPELINQ